MIRLIYFQHRPVSFDHHHEFEVNRMKKSTARRTERKAKRDEKRDPTITDPIDGKGWTIHPGACPVRWEDPPEPKQQPRGPRVVGQMAWRDD